MAAGLARLPIASSTPRPSYARRLGKVNVEHLSAGDVISLRTPGGGGYGDPMARDAAKVVDDVLDGFISPEAARTLYGVVLDGGAVNTVATETVRRRAEPLSSAPRYDFGAGRSAYRQQFSTAVLDELSGLLATLPHSLRYRGKQVAFEAMLRNFRETPVTPGWLGQNWGRIENTLFGTTQAA